MSYLRGLYLDSFQTTRRHSYNGYSIYIAIFTSFLQGVYPIGMTEIRPYFTQIIGNNSVNVHRIPIKLGTEIHFNEPLRVPNFSPIEARIGVYGRFCKVCEKKKQKKKPKK